MHRHKNTTVQMKRLSRFLKYLILLSEQEVHSYIDEYVVAEKSQRETAVSNAIATICDSMIMDACTYVGPDANWTVPCRHVVSFHRAQSFEIYCVVVSSHAWRSVT